MAKSKEKSLPLLIWPAIIKYPDDAELLYINSQAEWDSDTGLHTFNYDEADYLIDSIGNSFTLTKRINDVVQPERANTTHTLNEILGMVKGHASQMGSCCVSKLYAPSIDEAFKIVKSLSEN